jgi:hypothetical protein
MIIGNVCKLELAMNHIYNWVHHGLGCWGLVKDDLHVKTQINFIMSMYPLM